VLQGKWLEPWSTLRSHDPLLVTVPNRRRALEVRVIRQMATDGRVVAELFVLDHFFARAYGLEEVGFVVHEIAIALRNAEDFGRVVDRQLRKRMLLLKIGQILIAQLRRPPIDRIGLGLRTRILWREGQAGPADNRRSLSSKEANELALIVVQIAAQINPEVGIVIQGLNQIGKVAAIFEVEQTTCRLRALRGGSCPSDEMDPGDQVHEQVARQALAIVGETAPTEETLLAERPFRGVS